MFVEQPSCNVSEVIGNPQANLFQVVRSICKSLTNMFCGVTGSWQPSDKFVRGVKALLQKAHICQMVANTL
jgi:hypothetical protein